MTLRALRFSWVLLALPLLTGCPKAKVAEGVLGPLGTPWASATAEQKATFERGLAVAEHRWSPDEGLGPMFNTVISCTGCHERPVGGGGGPRYRNFLLVGDRLDSGAFLPTGKNGVQNNYELTEGRFDTDLLTNVFATRSAIPFFGSGLLAEIPEREILSRADPSDADGDGISGRANLERGFVGRFGRKAQASALEGFTRGPINNHVGITTDPLTTAQRAALPIQLVDAEPQNLAGGLGQGHGFQASSGDAPTTDNDDITDPELGGEDLFDLVSFTMLMAGPAPDEQSDDAKAGAERFEDLGCAACHVPALEGPRGLIPAYSDLLIHDMGEDLADGIPMGIADGNEFRTHPLWGVASTGPYLHDGRADTLVEAIEAHGGEAQSSRDAFVSLEGTEQDQVIAFLESLGGAELVSEGLLPPGAATPDAGTFGGPVDANVDMALFEMGRRVFDRNISRQGGLGPGFNGDACRACHFDPVIGGSGPLGVNVTRHGYPLLDGSFTAPAQGTMAHRQHSQLDLRAPAEEDASFELRQTPPLFGLGLIDAIPDAAIEALEDPTDANADGIRGRVHRLPDGRIGRFGWKGGVPTLAEFTRDAMFNEMGVTLPDQPGHTFGGSTDADDAPDPEITVDELAAVNHFMGSLSPPPGQSTDAAAEGRGETLFAQVGCDGCHVPELQTASGDPVRLYSDLLLHEVVDPVAAGIADGQAGIWDFRTSPLWGISQSGPWLHDGRAHTLDAAIRGHAGEATAAVTAYDALSATERGDLIAFLNAL